LPFAYLGAGWAKSEPQWAIAEEVLSRPEYKRERAWFDKIVALPPLLTPPKVLSEVLSCTINALLDEHMLQVEYATRTGEEKSAEVMPLGIAEHDQVHWLVVRFSGYNNVRQLRLDRISAAVALEEQPFRYPADFNLQAYVDSGAFLYNISDKQKLVIRIRTEAARHLLDTPLAHDQQYEQQDEDWVQVTATVPLSSRLTWWLLGFGRKLEVLAPDVLRQQMAEEALAMAVQYQ